MNSSKVSFFVWTAHKGHILMIDNLKKGGIPIPNMCYLCRRDEELIDHLLIGCPFAMEVWLMVLQEVGLSWIAPNTSSDFLEQWMNFGLGRKGKKIW